LTPFAALAEFARMLMRLAALFVTLSALSGLASSRCAVAAPRAVRPATVTMPIDDWVALEPQSVPAAPVMPGTRRLDTSVAPDGSESIIVPGHGHHRDQDWREDQLAAAPIYEARNSAAAQPLYAPPAVWDSPEEQHTMSSAKDAMGLCGALGGWITCPNR
jgi:hypothetical protein